MKIHEIIRILEQNGWLLVATRGSHQPRDPTVKDVEHEIREAIRFHIEGLRADGFPVPEPSSIAEYVDA